MRKENMKYSWRVLILDVRNMYTQIYDEVYGNNSATLQELYDKYSMMKGFVCLILEE